MTLVVPEELRAQPINHGNSKGNRENKGKIREQSFKWKPRATPQILGIKKKDNKMHAHLKLGQAMFALKRWRTAHHHPRVSGTATSSLEAAYAFAGGAFLAWTAHSSERTGRERWTKTKEAVELKEGPLEQFTHEMEPFLRKQGLPVRLNRGVVELVADHVVCEEGKPLSPEAAQTLRLLGIQMATFRLYLVCRWSCDDFEVYKEGLAHLGADDSS
ncbi:hypothetical protein C2845_PM04G01660 [Panicum miliaceum]|uniref:Large ribosomal subunit protein uL10-like insertion domain-containing protein n=1 Tax=Panicum miliaceum TaxID=4540 RepID=A0A3L6QQX0_PANMI|nr:hypothetical protein C2845_PM04G01660 [Panicum miliaceum]